MLIEAHLTDWFNMLGLRDKVKEQTGRMVVTRPIKAHLTNWLNMLGLRDKVKE